LSLLENVVHLLIPAGLLFRLFQGIFMSGSNGPGQTFIQSVASASHFSLNLLFVNTYTAKQAAENNHYIHYLGGVNYFLAMVFVVFFGIRINVSQLKTARPKEADR